jgi:acetyl-CoA carboxylase carboxyltransferase component
MGLEGAVNIIYKKDLEGAATAEERADLHARHTAGLKKSNTAIESAAKFLYDDVIDPAETRGILVKTLDTLPIPARQGLRKRTIEPF